MDNIQKPFVLKPEVAAKYDCISYPGRVRTAWGEQIDMREINLKEADRLVKRGFDLLVLKKESPAKVEGTSIPETATGSKKHTNQKSK
jgi:hypothetical protein